MSSRTLWFVAAAALIVPAATVPAPRSIRAVCVVSPRAVWTLAEPASGRLESRAVDMLTGETLHFQLFQFERSSFVSFEMDPTSIPPGDDYCPPGTIIARIGSSALELQVAERLSALEEANAHLEALKGGSKPAEREVAAVKTDRARAAFDVFQPEVERVRALHDQGLVTDEERQLTEGESRLRALDLQLAEAELRALEVGARPEEIAEAEIVVSNIGAELRELRRKGSATLIATPMGGRLRFGSGSGAAPESQDATVLAGVVRNDTMVVQILVDQRQREKVHEDQQVWVRIPGLDGPPCEGTISRVGKMHRPLGRHQVFVARALVPNPGERLEPGMRGSARILEPPRPLLRTWLDDVRKALRRQGRLP